MTLALIVYLIGVLPSIGETIGSIGLFCLFAGTFIGFMGLMFVATEGMPGEAVKKAFVRFYKYTIPIILFSFIISALIPSERVLYTMVAAYGVETIATNDKAQKIFGSGVEILNMQMDKYKKELLKETEK